MSTRELKDIARPVSFDINAADAEAAGVQEKYLEIVRFIEAEQGVLLNAKCRRLLVEALRDIYSGTAFEEAAMQFCRDQFWKEPR